MSNGQLETPIGWEKVRLKELAQIVSGVTKGRRFNGADTVFAPYLRVANVQAGRLDLSEIKEVEVLPGDVEKYRLHPGDVLMTEGGDRDKLGRGTIWRGEVDNCIHQNHIFRVRPDRRRLLPEFLSLYLGSPEAKAYFLRAAKQTTGIASINSTQLSEFPVALPPLSEQRRIAAILDKADAIRRKRGEGIRLTEELLRSIFLDMFGDPVANPNGWPQRPLGDLLTSIENGWSPKCHDRPVQDGEWGVLKLGAATYCTYRPNENKALPQHERPRPEIEVKPGDILLTRKNTYDLVAACAYVFETPPRLMLPDLIFRLRISEEKAVLPEYLWGLLTHPGKRKGIQSLAGGSAGSMPNISKEKLLRHPIEIPPLALQQRFACIKHNVHRLGLARRSQVAAQEKLFDSLVQRAFRGEL